MSISFPSVESDRPEPPQPRLELRDVTERERPGAPQRPLQHAAGDTQLGRQFTGISVTHASTQVEPQFVRDLIDHRFGQVIA